jgi:hypothetical protein
MGVPQARIDPPATDVERHIDKDHAAVIRLATLCGMLLAKGLPPAEVLRRVRVCERTDPSCLEAFGSSERVAQRVIAEWRNFRSIGI